MTFAPWLRGTGSHLPSDAQGTLNLRASAWYFLCVNADGRAMLGSLFQHYYFQRCLHLCSFCSVTAAASVRQHMRPALTIYCRRRSARGVTDCSESPLLRPDTDRVALTASCCFCLSPFLCRHCELLDSHVESAASTVHSGTRATPCPCHLPRACLHILGYAVVCPRWTSPQLKQAAAASRSLSRPELTRKVEALNQDFDPYLPVLYDAKPCPN